MNQQARSILNALLDLYWSVRFLLLNPGNYRSADFGVHLLITFYDEPDTERFREYEFCIRWNLKNPYIKKIHVFYENRKLDVPPFLKHEKVQIHDYRTAQPKTMTFARLFEFAHEQLPSEVAVIANTDIYFDQTLRKLRRQELSNRVLALTRHNRGIYGSHYCEIWKRRPNSQDSWIFKTPLPDFNGNIRMGWKGSDNKLAYELKKAGVAVTNPSKDIRTWHYHRSSARSYVSNRQSYLLEHDFNRVSCHVPICGLIPDGRMQNV